MRLGLLKENALNKVVKRLQPNKVVKRQQLKLRQVTANIFNKMEEDNLIAEDQEMLEEQQQAFLDFFDKLEKKKLARLQRCDSLQELHSKYPGYFDSRQSSRAASPVFYDASRDPRLR